MARPSFLAIEGVIGVGKTTLARLLQQRLKADLLLEAFDQNPFLSDFYSDRARYAFQTQIFFLLSRFRQQQAVGPRLARGPLIADYIFSKDSLFAHLNLRGDELAMYERLYDVLFSEVVSPHLVLYLRASPQVLMARIAMRDRSYERAMDQGYIEDLWGAYEQFFRGYSEAPLLVVDTDDLDFVRNPEDLDAIEGQIQARLALGAYQRTLPHLGLASQRPLAEYAQAPGAGQAQDEGRLWCDAVEDYLAISQAVGRLAALLAPRVPGPLPPGVGGSGAQGSRASLQLVLGELAAHVERLSHAVGVDLSEAE